MRATLVHDILDRRARRSPHAVAVRKGDIAWTYCELRQLTLAYAAWLARQGVTRGDRILAVGSHAAAAVPAVYAASRLGAMYVVVSDQLRPYILDHIVADSEPRIVLVDGDPDRNVAKGLGHVPVHSFAEIPAATTARPPGGTPCLSVDPVSLIYTSGSTAMPKAVVSTHQQVLFAAHAIQSQLQYQHDDVVFCCLPLSFDYGLYQVFLAAMAGAELVLGDASDAGPPLLWCLRKHSVTVLPVVPSMAAALVMLLARAGPPPERLRMVTNTGAALPDQVAGRLEALVPGVAVFRMFGLTECKRVSILQPHENAVRPGSVGRALPGTEVFIVGDRGQRLPPGEVGELVVRGQHVMSGYWRAPDLTSARFRRDDLGGVALYTGDLCRLDTEGYLYFAGRRDELYKQRGFRISAVEVEAAAMDIPGVELAAVLPPAGDRGAILVAGGEITVAELHEQLAQRLENVRLPSGYHVLTALPLQPGGKVDKKALASILASPLTECVAR
ncbi:MAG TPA: AMP-binding protein [Streptosporangiaceae bacterium]